MAVEIAPAQTVGMISGLVQRPPELGRIRLGEKKMAGQKEYPSMLKTFRLTSGSRTLLEVAAKLYGGQVKPWPDAPDEGQWQLVTAAAELDILIPTAIRNISQAYELWQGGTNERRCDGATVTTIDGPAPCICAAKGLDGAARECEIVTRLSVMLPRVPGLGVWRLDTGGWQAATTLPTTLTLLSALSPGSAWMPAVLRAEQRSKKERLPDGKVQTHRFVVPVLDLPGTTLGQFIADTGVDLPAPQLTAGERPAQPTARERVAAERARAERPQTVTPAQMEDGDWPAGATPVKPQPDVTVEAPSVEVVTDAGAITPPAPASAAQCDGFDPSLGRCVREPHEGTNHRNKSGESWK